MNEQQEAQLLANIKSITDRLDMVDKVFKAAKMGAEMVLVFRCNESGLYFPADYVREWGRKWGIGLGMDVCSETLQTQYEIAPPMPDKFVTSLDQIMHPVRSSKCQVDAILVDAYEALDKMAIPAVEDELMRARAPIILSKQRANPESRLYVIKGMSSAQATLHLNTKGWR